MSLATACLKYSLVDDISSSAFQVRSSVSTFTPRASSSLQYLVSGTADFERDKHSYRQDPVSRQHPFHTEGRSPNSGCGKVAMGVSTSKELVSLSEDPPDTLQSDDPTVTYNEAVVCCKLCKSFGSLTFLYLETLLDYEGKGCSLGSLLLRLLRLYDAEFDPGLCNGYDDSGTWDANLGLFEWWSERPAEPHGVRCLGMSLSC